MRCLPTSAPSGFADLSALPEEHQNALRQCVVVVPDFVSIAEEQSLVEVSDEQFAAKGLDYERGPGMSTGGCIDKYREYDAHPADFGNASAGEVIRRMRAVLKVLAVTRQADGFPGSGFSLDKMPRGEEATMALGVIDASVPEEVLYPVHRVIDLAPDGGVITPHVDEQDTFGRFILVLNLLADSVIRLRRLPPLSRGDQWSPCLDEFADVAVPRRGAYLLEGLSRYAYAHEVLSGSGPAHELSWSGRSWRRGRRLSIVGRDAGPVLSPLDQKAFAPTIVAGELVGPGTHWPCRGTALDEGSMAKLAAWVESFGRI